MCRSVLIAILLLPAVWGCDGDKNDTTEKKGGKEMAIKLSSPAFGDDEMIPSKYT